MEEVEKPVAITQRSSEIDEPVCEIKKEFTTLEEKWNEDCAHNLQIKAEIADAKYDICNRDITIKLEPVSEEAYIKNEDIRPKDCTNLTVHTNQNLRPPKSNLKTKEATILLSCSACGYNCTCKDQTKKVYNCSTCDYTCKYKTSIIKHIRIHTGEKPYKCKTCDYTCTQKITLNRHTLTHTGEKPFECRICKYKCARKSALKSHLLTHSGEKLFKCGLCDHRCNSKGGLENHYLTHLEEKPFKCGLCDYGCDDENSLQRHILNHLGENPIDYYYTVCEYRALHRSILKEHNYSFPYCARNY